MKFSNELKVGLMALAAIIALLLGFRFLKGKDVFNRTPKVYAIFKSIGGLDKSSFVKINGLTVGNVYAMEPADENINNIKVTISISKNVNIPSNSVAYISGSLLGVSNIVIEKGDAKTYLQNGDKIATRQEDGLLGDLTSEAKPLMGKVGNAADSLTLLLSGINNTLDAATQHNLQATIVGLNQSAAALHQLLTTAAPTLAAALQNMNSIMENLKNQNDTISQILSNAKSFTNNFAQLRLEQTLDSLNATLSDLRNKMSSSGGSLGALMNDRQLYDRLNKIGLSAEILLDDIRVHPKRYVNISVFGKKDKSGALTAPAVKDSVAK
jgi:phospholipid/cholesterol/gamma-HCH transport system substrate-binding protein